MNSDTAWFPKRKLLGTLGVAAIETTFWGFIGGFNQPILINLAYFLIAGLLAVLGGALLAQRANPDLVQNDIDIAHADQIADLQQRLDATMQLNQLLIESQNERDLVERALAVIARLSGAVGVSFMPFDEWGQPLTTYTFGEFPAPVLRAWADHLSSGPVRNRCKVCQILESKSGDNCPLLESPFSESIRVYCMPLNRRDHLVGLLNLYMPIEKPIETELYTFITVMLRELVLAVEMLRLRGQELTTLRQMQMLNQQEDDGREIITRLLEGLCDVLEFQAARVEFKSAPPQFEGMHIQYGAEDLLQDRQLTATIRDIFSGEQQIEDGMLLERVLDEGHVAIFTPCSLGPQVVIGVLALINDHPIDLEQRERALAITVAEQAAILVDNIRKQLDREYRAVIQERIRLAREIHDSLAQTLAYLKLTAAQMQTQLANGDLARLQSSLNQSYQALSEAYLDTRQAIDNLRLTPLKNISAWVEQILDEFRETSGLATSSKISQNLPEISPEIQAQLIRVVQEALSNVRKHAQAKKVTVSLRAWKNDMIIEISDDGVGFSAEDVPDLSRHGLRGMRERAELIGADFQIISQPANGTTIRLQLPLNLEETLA